MLYSDRAAFALPSKWTDAWEPRSVSIISQPIGSPVWTRGYPWGGDHLLFLGYLAQLDWFVRRHVILSSFAKERTFSYPR